MGVLKVMREDGKEGRIKNLSEVVSGGIFMPTIIGSGFMSARFYILGASIIVVCFFVSTWLGAFKLWKDWPFLPKISMIFSPFIFMSATVISRFPEQNIWKAFWIVFAYGVLSVFSTYSLLRKFPHEQH